LFGSPRERRIRDVLAFVGAILLAVASVGSAPRVAELPLPDQYGEEDSLAAYRGEVAVVIVVTARRLRNVRAWEEELRGRYEAVRFLRITDVPEDSPASLDDVARKLRKRVPEGVRVLIDLHRAWATELHLETGRPNVLVFDRQGRLNLSVRGLAEPSLLDQVAGAIDALEAGP
jgi:hypothetical protein